MNRENKQKLRDLTNQLKISELRNKEKERAVEQEAGAKDYWKKLYDELRGKFYEKIEADRVMRKGEIERAGAANRTLGEKEKQI